MKLEPENESAKKHGLENTHNGDVKGQKTQINPESKNADQPENTEPAKKHGKEDIK